MPNVRSGGLVASSVVLGLLWGCASKSASSSAIVDPGSGGPPTTLNGVMFPWEVWDAKIPDVPPSVAPAKTVYCDPVKGNDTWDGSTFTAASGPAGPLKTLGAALKLVTAGDTILLGGGIYRERPSFGNSTGKPGAPITIGSYGHGTGAPIVDGGVKPGTWTKYTAQGQTTVWQTSTAGLKAISATTPVMGIYVNGPSGESALREVIHGQVTPYASDPLPPNQTQADIKDDSNNWFFDAAGGMLYADFGGSLGTADPNTVDISLIYDSYKSPSGHEPLFVLFEGHGYFTFIGLTLRAASWHGAYAETSGNTFDHCDVKFNGGGGIAFDTGQGDSSITGNTVKNTRIWMNVLNNWPRFNNANTGGGWPGALSWYSQADAWAQGNVIFGNGGEGLVVWGTNSEASGHKTGMTEVRNNVIHDNWSVNLYMDNTQLVRAEENFIFDHPFDPTLTFAGLLEASKGYAQDFGRRMMPVNVSLGDEPGSAYDGAAHLSNITLINNVIVGGKFGFVDYDDGTKVVFHGLKNCLIANNTWVLWNGTFPGQVGYGWRHLYSGSKDASANSIVQNNLFAITTMDDHFVEANSPGAGPGIMSDYNLFSGPGVFIDQTKSLSLAAWQTSGPGWDKHSLAAEAMIVEPTEFTQTAAQKPVYDWTKAKVMPGSPAIGAGAPPTSAYGDDFTGTKRASGAATIGAIAP